MAKRDSMITWRALEERHREAVARNYERSEMLKAIIMTWEERGDYDADWMRDLKKRQRQAETQLKAMKP